MRFNHINFIQIWERAESVQDVMMVLGISYTQATRRATMLRKNGYTLKRMYRNSEFYSAIGRKGGRVLTDKKKGFQIDDRSFLDKLLGKPSRASRAGHLGGVKSKRGAAHA